MSESKDLRTRIAAVVHQYSVPIPMAELVADAVIRELGGEEVLRFLEVPQRILMGRIGEITAEGNKWVPIEMEADDE